MPTGRSMDLCTGSGIVPCLLAAHGLEATGIDIQPGWAELWEHTRAPRRPTLVLGDARDLQGAYDLVTCNPPFQPQNTGPLPTGPLKAAAHVELHGTLRELHTVAMDLRASEGWVVFVIPAARVNELPSPTLVVQIDSLALCAWGDRAPESVRHLDRERADAWVRRCRTPPVVSSGPGGTAP